LALFDNGECRLAPKMTVPLSGLLAWTELLLNVCGFVSYLQEGRI